MEEDARVELLLLIDIIYIVEMADKTFCRNQTSAIKKILYKQTNMHLSKG